MPSSLSSLFSWAPILIWSLWSPMLGDWKQFEVWMLSVMTGVTGEYDKAMKDNLVLMSLQFTLCKPGPCAMCALQVWTWQVTRNMNNYSLTIHGIWDNFKVFIYCRTFVTGGGITLRDQIIPRIVVNWPCCDLSQRLGPGSWVLGPSSGLRLCQLTRVQPGNSALS